jgi:hypothetical protein
MVTAMDAPTLSGAYQRYAQAHFEERRAAILGPDSRRTTDGGGEPSGQNCRHRGA